MIFLGDLKDSDVFSSPDTHKPIDIAACKKCGKPEETEDEEKKCDDGNGEDEDGHLVVQHFITRLTCQLVNSVTNLRKQRA